jgi:branched-chain amino acid transport system substrate-binding protein
MKSRIASIAIYLAGFGLVFGPAGAFAETIKIGSILTFSGPNASLGDNLNKGIKLYVKLNKAKLPPGVDVEIISRDDTGPNPDKAKQIAQELIVRDKVQLLTGMIWTPNAAAIAPLLTEAKVPMVIMNATGSAITTLSPYIARVSFAPWQSTLPLGAWAATKFKRVYTVVSDFSAGHDSLAAFTKGYTEAGGNIVGGALIPLANPDFAAFLQRAKDARPDALYVFVPAGKQALSTIKTFKELALDKAGITLIGTGDITTDEELPNMGDAALGTLTVFHYSAVAQRPANKAFVAAFKKEYGEQAIPNFMAEAAWDGMDAIYHVIREQNGKLDPDRSMEILKRYRNDSSPRGPMFIDPETRDVVHNVYLREVRRVNGQLANVELETLATAVKDPWKELNKKK